MRAVWALIVMPRSRSRSILSRNCVALLARRERLGGVEQPIGERALAVVDVRDDAEVADVRAGRSRAGPSSLRERLDWKYA